MRELPSSPPRQYELLVHTGAAFSGSAPHVPAGIPASSHALKVAIDGSELLVCAVGGSSDQRKKQIARGASGALRILNAA
jgi:hypothetical protein